jgi:RND family efflux transporter MFP subunit
MAERKSLLPVILPVAILVVGALGAIGLVMAKRMPERREREIPPPVVRVLEVRPETIRLDVDSYGKVAPRTESDLVAQVAGTIVEVSPRLAAGAAFEKGETLATIDPRDFEIAVTRAEAAVAQAEVALALQEGEARVARRDWEELGEGEPDPLVLREPQVAEARAARNAARAALEKARLDLERTRIRAPYAGRVLRKSVDLGQYVGPGTPVARVYATDAVEVRLPVTLEDLAYVDLESGPPVALTAEVGGRDRRWIGRVVRTEGAIDPATRMLHAVARVDDPWGDGEDPALAVGLFVEGGIAGRTVENAYRVPRAALRDDGRVVLVGDEGRIELRNVEVVRIDGEDAIVVDGLEPGEKVCLSIVASAIEGMRVRVERPSPESGLAAPSAREEATPEDSSGKNDGDGGSA